MTDDSGRTITCPRYQRCGESRRCVHYLDGGRCARSGSSGAACGEWVKVNGGQDLPEAKPDQPTPPEPNRDLFGNPVLPDRPRRGSNRGPATKVTAPTAPTAAPTAPPTAPPPAPPKPPLVRNITDEEIASFKALGAEVCIRSAEAGEVWIVPVYSGADRMELSVEHSITLTTICSAFPGAKVVAIKRT